MNANQIAACPQVDRPPEVYSADWWAARSTDELRDIIRHGHRLGPAFEGAAVETEKRARAHEQEEAEAALARAAGKQRTRRVSLEGLLLILLVASVAMVLMR